MPHRNPDGAIASYSAVLVQRDSDPLDDLIKAQLAKERELRQRIVMALAAAKASLEAALKKAATGLSLSSALNRFRSGRLLSKAWVNYSSEVVTAAPQVLTDGQSEFAGESLKGLNRWKGIKGKFSSTAIFTDAEREGILRHHALYLRKHFSIAEAQRAKYALTEAYSLYRSESDQSTRDRLMADHVWAKMQARMASEQSYWRNYVTNSLTAARSYAYLKTYEQLPGVVGYRLVAVLDSATTMLCRSLHNRVFPLEPALQRMDAMFTATNLNQLQDVRPFIQHAKDGSHYVTQGGLNVPVDISDTRSLMRAGAMTPPFHHGCRTIMEPVYGLLDWERIEQLGLDQSEMASLARLEMIQDPVEFAEELTNLRTIEVVGVFKDGKQVFAASSYDSGMVAFNFYQALAMNGADVVHNHLPGRLSPLSNADIVTAITSNVHSITATAVFQGERIAHTLTRSPDKSNWGALLPVLAIDSRPFSHQEFDSMIETVADLRFNSKTKDFLAGKMVKFKNGEITETQLIDEVLAFSQQFIQKEINGEFLVNKL